MLLSVLDSDEKLRLPAHYPTSKMPKKRKADVTLAERARPLLGGAQDLARRLLRLRPGA